MLDWRKGASLKRNQRFMLALKIFAWAVAIFLSGSVAATIKGAGDVHIAGGLYWNTTASRISFAFLLLLAAFAVVIWVFAPLAWSHLLKVFLCVVFFALTIFLQQLIKDWLE